ncbi:hypothetical protein BT63DRAFT_455411 [Microthyrium microscopicum]|uniref:Uncharacterized protein n=1 Tax=Microthyrium microscopicum TaxID=703497 RepID=A0A6A6UD98_9PEZI|nr:hypothetical protein BT63DRAFT_455411 [Microthyrium microscopicum]
MIPLEEQSLLGSNTQQHKHYKHFLLDPSDLLDLCSIISHSTRFQIIISNFPIRATSLQINLCLLYNSSPPKPTDLPSKLHKPMPQPKQKIQTSQAPRPSKWRSLCNKAALLLRLKPKSRNPQESRPAINHESSPLVPQQPVNPAVGNQQSPEPGTPVRQQTKSPSPDKGSPDFSYAESLHIARKRPATNGGVQVNSKSSPDAEADDTVIWTQQSPEHQLESPTKPQSVANHMMRNSTYREKMLQFLKARIFSGNERKQRHDETVYLQQQSITKLQASLEAATIKVDGLQTDLDIKNRRISRLQMIEVKCNSKIVELKSKLLAKEKQMARQATQSQAAQDHTARPADADDAYRNAILELQRVKQEVLRLEIENNDMRQKLAWNPISNFIEFGGYPSGGRVRTVPVQVLFDDREASPTSSMRELPQIPVHDGEMSTMSPLREVPQIRNHEVQDREEDVFGEECF